MKQVLELWAVCPFSQHALRVLLPAEDTARMQGRKGTLRRKRRWHLLTWGLPFRIQFL